jgi:hypothetical protein
MRSFSRSQPDRSSCRSSPTVREAQAEARMLADALEPRSTIRVDIAVTVTIVRLPRQPPAPHAIGSRRPPAHPAARRARDASTAARTRSDSARRQHFCDDGADACEPPRRTDQASRRVSDEPLVGDVPAPLQNHSRLSPSSARRGVGSKSRAPGRGTGPSPSQQEYADSGQRHRTTGAGGDAPAGRRARPSFRGDRRQDQQASWAYTGLSRQTDRPPVALTLASTKSRDDHGR